VTQRSEIITPCTDIELALRGMELWLFPLWRNSFPSI